MFRNELKDQISNANKKREMYENGVQCIFRTEIFFGVLAGISKVFSLTDKLHQRTSICLQYDELRMKWEFEKVKDPERLNE